MTDWGRRLAASDRSGGSVHHQDRRRSSQILDAGILDRDYGRGRKGATATTYGGREGGYGRSVGQILLDNGYGGRNSGAGAAAGGGGGRHHHHQGQANEGYGGGRHGFGGGPTDPHYPARDREMPESTGTGPDYYDTRSQDSRLRDAGSVSMHRFIVLFGANPSSFQPGITGTARDDAAGNHAEGRRGGDQAMGSCRYCCGYCGGACRRR